MPLALPAALATIAAAFTALPAQAQNAYANPVTSEVLQGWDLPDEFATLRRLLEARMGKKGKREYVQVLRLLETFEMDHVHGAIRQALDLGAIGYDAVKARAPRIIYCSISAYGQDGPWRDRATHDLGIQAELGLLAANLGADGADIPGQHALYSAVGAHRHECRGFHGTAGELQAAEPGLAIAVQVLELHAAGLAHGESCDSRLAVMNMASP